MHSNLVGKEVKPELAPVDAWRLKPQAIYTKLLLGDCIVMDHSLQSTEVDFGTSARDFSHRAEVCQPKTDLTDFREIHPKVIHELRRCKLRHTIDLGMVRPRN